jgi:hypothetical protein
MSETVRHTHSTLGTVVTRIVTVQALQAIFRTELDAQLLAEILEAIDGAVSKQTAPDTVSSQLIVQHAAAQSLQVQQDAVAHISRADVHENTVQQQTPAEAERQVEFSSISSISSSKECKAAQAGEVVGMLQALAQAGRFSLARQLMPAKGQQAAASIFRWLQRQAIKATCSSSVLTPDSLATLQADYGTVADTNLSKPGGC